MDNEKLTKGMEATKESINEEIAKLEGLRDDLTAKLDEVREALEQRDYEKMRAVIEKYDRDKIDLTKTAHLTGEAYQDDETFKSEGGFEAERDQLYFKMKQNDNEFLVGLKDLLICLRLAETMGEVPKLENPWWIDVSNLYDEFFPVIDFKEYKV